jgi:hypothetical protein
MLSKHSNIFDFEKMKNYYNFVQLKGCLVSSNLIRMFNRMKTQLKMIK